MRKIILAGLICAVFVSGMFVGMMQVASAAQQDSPPNIASRLNAIADQLAHINGRLSSVLSGVSAPGDPEIINALHTIRTNAQSIIAQVDLKLGTP